MAMEVVRNLCAVCARYTNHEVEASKTEHGDPSEYHFVWTHSIVRCLGCDKRSFRDVYEDYENGYPDEENGWAVPTDVSTYPKRTKGTLEAWVLPKVVRDIYQETCSAFAEGSLTLAGIGFRATIEAICNDRGVNGKELSTRIGNLATQGLISKKDSARLHSIRFMGNDAAHEIVTPSKESLAGALAIIEHLITTVYLVDQHQAAGGLDSVLELYEDFEKLLEKKISAYHVGDSYPLSKFFGKDIRRLHGGNKKFESELNARIGRGDFTKLSRGALAKYAGSPEVLQHYTLT
jgi:hypothetical protein